MLKIESQGLQEQSGYRVHLFWSKLSSAQAFIVPMNDCEGAWFITQMRLTADWGIIDLTRARFSKPQPCLSSSCNLRTQIHRWGRLGKMRLMALLNSSYSQLPLMAKALNDQLSPHHCQHSWASKLWKIKQNKTDFLCTERGGKNPVHEDKIFNKMKLDLNVWQALCLTHTQHCLILCVTITKGNIWDD